jgi:hypothetical protein
MTIYTSVPSENASKNTIIKSNQNFKSIVTDYLICIEKNLKVDLQDFKNKVTSLDNSKKLHPSIYFYFREVQESVKYGIIKDLKINLAKLYGSIISKQSSIDMSITSILSEDWEDEYVAHLREYDQKDICGNTTVVLPIDEYELYYHKNNIIKAIEIIQKYVPELHQEIDSFVTHIKLFKGEVLRGDTSARVLGAMWIRVPEQEDDQVGYWIEHIVHETSHIRLEHLFLMDKIVLNSAEEKVFKAPIRNDLRPMKGIFHATFVLSRMIMAFYLISTKAKMHKRFRDRLQLCKLQYDIGKESLKHPMASFSEIGKGIIRTLDETAHYSKL